MMKQLSSKTPVLVGIHGPLNGGKDTVANIIQSMFPEDYRRYAFAEPLKKAGEVLFGFTRHQMEDRVLKEAPDPFWGFTPRKAIQLLGTEYGRDSLREDVWIKRAELELLKNNNDGYKTIITDVRFENEAAWIRSVPNSILIYLKVPGLERDEKYNHASEAGIELIDTDFVIINDKSLGINNLFRQIEHVFTDRDVEFFLPEFSE
jgi:hypothetical protein